MEIFGKCSANDGTREVLDASTVHPALSDASENGIFGALSDTSLVRGALHSMDAKSTEANPHEVTDSRSFKQSRRHTIELTSTLRCLGPYQGLVTAQTSASLMLQRRRSRRHCGPPYQALGPGGLHEATVISKEKRAWLLLGLEDLLPRNGRSL
jgi:hypothetical protein